MTNPRTIAMIALASGTFGGTVGALASAAVQSDASPQAIAAAVQKVQDSAGERSLASISRKLGSIDGAISSTTQAINTQGATISSAINLESHYQGFDADAIYSELSAICRNTLPSPNLGPLCPFSLPPTR